MASFKERKVLNVSDMLSMSRDLWEVNKESWAPMSPEHGRTFILYMIEEIGEVIALIKKKGEKKIMEEAEIRERFVEEMTDVMMYYSDVMNRFDITAEEFSKAYQKKFEKNMSRNYDEDHDKH